MFNQAFFERIMVWTEDEGVAVEGELAEPFRSLIGPGTKEPRPIAQQWAEFQYS